MKQWTEETWFSYYKYKFCVFSSFGKLSSMDMKPNDHVACIKQQQNECWFEYDDSLHYLRRTSGWILSLQGEINCWVYSWKSTSFVKLIKYVSTNHLCVTTKYTFFFKKMVCRRCEAAVISFVSHSS